MSDGEEEENRMNCVYVWNGLSVACVRVALPIVHGDRLS